MKQGLFTILENSALTESVFRMVLCGDTSDITRPGQFVNILLDGHYLRRPISVCDLNGDKLTVLYKTVGQGTVQMSRFPAGRALDLLTGLGNGYDLSRSGDTPIVIGGGVGVPPMYWLAKELIRAGKSVTAVLGFNRAAEVFFEAEFRALGVKTVVTTVDGSYGTRGFVTDALSHLPFDFYYACGPEPMLKAIFAAAPTDGQLSFERRMGCGFGACMGCSCKTVSGNKRICKEGPVMNKEDILWNGSV